MLLDKLSCKRRSDLSSKFNYSMDGFSKEVALPTLNSEL